MATRWPYWNASVEAKQSRHLLTLTCDHGPGDCNFVDQNPLRLGKLPDTWNPASPTRVVSQVQWNSLRDGADAGQDFCSVCFQSGKDVQLATPEGNVCGPLCGYKCVSMQAAWFYSHSLATPAHVLFLDVTHSMTRDRQGQGVGSNEKNEFNELM